MSNPETAKRTGEAIQTIGKKAAQDCVSFKEYIRRFIEIEANYNFIHVKPEDDFVVLGINGTNGRLFACGSANNFHEARRLAMGEADRDVYEKRDNKNPMISAFLVFQKDGELVVSEEDWIDKALEDGKRQNSKT